ncbi:hypothetical protein BGX20_007551, partial [Mortierella sp. AD010]
MRMGASLFIHGPYQSGKTSLLRAIHVKLGELGDNAIFVNFDMSIKVKSATARGLDYNAILDGLSDFLSFQIFKEKMTWNNLETKLNNLSRSHPRIYILMDEFQSIFDSQHFLDVTKDLFRVITN